MDNMEKKAEEMETKETETKEAEAKETEPKEVGMNERMTERVNQIDTQTYWYAMQLLGLGTAEAEKKFPWDIAILREIFESAVPVLNNHGHNVCDPYISTPETGRQYRCTLSECECKHCDCQDEFMEKERLLSNIEDSAAMNGLKIMGGGKDSIIVRNEKVDQDFEISVTELAG